jgi:hypothetical protein
MIGCGSLHQSRVLWAGERTHFLAGRPACLTSCTRSRRVALAATSSR